MNASDRGAVFEAGGFAAADLDPGSTRTDPAQPSLQLPRLILHLPLDSIQESSPTQTRQQPFDPAQNEEDARLLASIRSHGVLEPVMVQRISPPGPACAYRLVFGHRRCAAAATAGLSHLPALIANTDDPVELLTLAENTGTRPLSPYERALALDHLQRSMPDRSLRTLARETGLSPSTVSNLLRAYRESTPHLRSLFAAGMDARAVVELGPRFHSLSESRQAELARTLQGRSRAAVRALLADRDQAPSPETAQVPCPAPREETPLPDPADPDTLATLSRQTGAAPDQAREILEAARAAHSTLPVVQLLCLCAGHGTLPDRPEGLIPTAHAELEQPAATRLLRDHLQLRARLHTHLARLDPGPGRSLLRQALGG